MAPRSNDSELIRYGMEFSFLYVMVTGGSCVAATSIARRDALGRHAAGGV